MLVASRIFSRFLYFLVGMMIAALIALPAARAEASSSETTSRSASRQVAQSGSLEGLTWSQYSKIIDELIAGFKDGKKTEKEKVKLLPRANEALSYVQDLSEKAVATDARIAKIVELIAAGQDADFANSMIDTTTDDYKKFSKIYKSHIAKISDTKLRKEIQETFEEFSKLTSDDLK